MQLKDLNPHPGNPRKISDPKLKMLEKSLKEFGDLSGIVFNKTTGRLVGGHQRLKVLPSNSKIVMDTETHGHVIIGGERFQYREVEWDELKEKAANIAANKHGGEFDLSGLSDWLLDLDQNNFDLELTGFDKDELADLMAPITKLDPQCDEDEVPEHVEPKSKLGDLYILGNHRLLCGDSTNIQHVDRLMNGDKADITFTSPPYNAARQPMLSEREAKKEKQSNKYLTHDDDNPGSWKDLMHGFTSNALMVSEYQFINLQLLAGNKVILAEWLHDFRNNLADVMIWDKQSGTPAMADNVLNSRFEFVFILSSQDKPSRGLPNPIWSRNLDNVYEADRQRKNEFSGIHAATFPVHFPEWFIEHFTGKNGSIYEPFAGTGTTAIACEKTNRKCFMMELDPHYCDVIVARWEKYTGKKASLHLGEGSGNA